MKYFAVEPVPNPMVIPLCTQRSAASAARRFSWSSWSGVFVVALEEDMAEEAYMEIIFANRRFQRGCPEKGVRFA
jgi:hypothetical protein